MRGLAIDLVWMDEAQWIPSNKVVGIICDQKFPLARVVEAIKECPWEAVWCYRDLDRVAMVAFDECGIDAVPIPLNPFYKGDKVDTRRTMRECEIMHGCTHVIVFRLASSDASKHWEGRASARGQITIVEYLPKGAKRK